LNTLQDAWEDLAPTFIDPMASEEMRLLMKMAFFGGAAATMALYRICENMSVTGQTAYKEGLLEECKMFTDQMYHQYRSQKTNG